MKKDFLTLFDYKSEEISQIINLGTTLKKERLEGITRNDLLGKSVAMIFDKPSLRTKATFETGIFELGGNALNISDTSGPLGLRESIHDIAKNLERWVHMIVVRTFAHDNVVQLSKFAKVPVINALTDGYHPCQSMAFGMLLKDKFDDNKVNISYIGDGNNVCLSHMTYAAKTGHNITVSTPKGYEPNKEITTNIQKVAETTGSKILITNDPIEAVKNTNIIYTDVWASMGQEAETKKRKEIFAPYQINASLFSKAPSDALFTHCLPAHRGEEVTDEVLDCERSVIFDEAENRLHAHKAIMIYLNESTKK